MAQRSGSIVAKLNACSALRPFSFQIARKHVKDTDERYDWAQGGFLTALFNCSKYKKVNLG